MNATQINADPMINEPKPTEEQLGVPDWTKAHKDATHWDSHMWRFCNEFGYFGFRGEFCLLDTHRWGTDRYTPRPVGSDKASDWNGTGLPPVGTVCEGVWLKMPGVGDRDFEGVIVKGYYKKQVWFCATSGEDITQLTENVYFRPIRNRREELEDLLTRASETGLTVKSLAGFIIARGYRLER